VKPANLEESHRERRERTTWVLAWCSAKPQKTPSAPQGKGSSKRNPALQAKKGQDRRPVKTGNGKIKETKKSQKTAVQASIGGQNKRGWGMHGRGFPLQDEGEQNVIEQMYKQ